MTDKKRHLNTRFSVRQLANSANAELPFPLEVCGRVLQIDREHARLLLASESAQIWLQFSKSSNPINPAAEDSWEQIQPLDLVQALVTKKIENPQKITVLWQAQELKCLVANQKDWPRFYLDSFNYVQSQMWQDFLFYLREFFVQKNFIEVRTPSLVECPGTEPTLQPFVTQWGWGSSRKNYYLPTSPELHLKKMLSLGWEKIFELKESFRNQELSAIHQPEFLMLEWYRAYDSLSTIATDLAELITFLNLKISQKYQAIFNLPSLDTKVVYTTMSELFQKYCEFKLTAKTTKQDLQKLCDRLLVAYLPEDEIDDLFHRVWLEKIENSLDKNIPLLVSQFPEFLSAYAKVNDEGWAERFELYWCGFEIANAFAEVNSAEEQRKRFARDIMKKKILGLEVVAMDPEFLQAIEFGLPPTGGIAMGVERLFLAITGLKDLSQARAFILGKSVED